MVKCIVPFCFTVLLYLWKRCN